MICIGARERLFLISKKIKADAYSGGKFIDFFAFLRGSEVEVVYFRFK
jgi:hypothetical protein